MGFAAACRSVSSPENSTKSQKAKLASSIAKGLSVTDVGEKQRSAVADGLSLGRRPEVRAMVEKCRRRALDRAIGHMSNRVNWAAQGITALAEKAVV